MSVSSCFSAFVGSKHRGHDVGSDRVVGTKMLDPVQPCNVPISDENKGLRQIKLRVPSSVGEQN